MGEPGCIRPTSRLRVRVLLILWPDGAAFVAGSVHKDATSRKNSKWT